MKIFIILLLQIFICEASFCATPSNQFKIMNEVIEHLDQSYVKPIDKKEYEKGAIKGIMLSLDPHSSYLNKKELQQLKNKINGEFGGIGVEVIITKGFPTVISPYEGGPAQIAGIKPGDIIVSANDQVLFNASAGEIENILRGPVGKTVSLKIKRDGEIKNFEIKRDIIKITPVKSKIVAKNVAYLKINTFNLKTASLLHEHYEKLAKTELVGVILDLRSNPGGLLEQAVDISNMFLEKNKTIVSIEGKNNKKIFTSDGEDMTKNLPIVVIINKGSASAAEIVAGALQDNKRAQILGEQSFGKGSVQVTVELTDGSAVRLTTALYYTPSGKSIQGIGIQPDIVVEDGMVLKKVPQQQIISESDLKNSLKNNTQPKNNEKEIFLYNHYSIGNESEDFQLMRAVDLVKTMSLYNKT